MTRSETPDRKRKHKSRHKEKGSKAKRSKHEKANKSKEKHRKSAGVDDADAEHELLMHAAMGSTKAMRKLLDARPRLDVDAFDATGATALHHACRQGHLEAAELLLRCALSTAAPGLSAPQHTSCTSAAAAAAAATAAALVSGGLPTSALHISEGFEHQQACGVHRRGADIDAEDFAGDSAAHLAATHGHLKLLTALLQARDPCSSPPHLMRLKFQGSPDLHTSQLFCQGPITGPLLESG